MVGAAAPYGAVTPHPVDGATDTRHPWRAAVRCTALLALCTGSALIALRPPTMRYSEGVSTAEFYQAFLRRETRALPSHAEIHRRARAYVGLKPLPRTAPEGGRADDRAHSAAVRPAAFEPEAPVAVHPRPRPSMWQELRFVRFRWCWELGPHVNSASGVDIYSEERVHWPSLAAIQMAILCVTAGIAVIGGSGVHGRRAARATDDLTSRWGSSP